MIYALYILLSLLIASMFVIARLHDRLKYERYEMQIKAERLADEELDRLKAKVQFEDESG